MNIRSHRSFCLRTSALLLAAVLFVVLCQAARAQSTAFTYQGQLRQNSGLVNVNSDFSFSLYGVASGGAPVAGPITVLNVPVTNGLFTASVDFGATPVTTADRYLEIATRSPAGSGVYTTLTTRQKITPAPYSLQTRGIVVDSTGNVGLGTSSPLGKLDLQAGADSTGFGDGKAISLSYRIGGYRHWIRSRHDASSPGGNAIEFFVNNSGTAAALTGPGTGNALVMSLLGSGNVGVGTTTPGSRLHSYTEVTDQAALEGQGYGINGTGVLGEGVAVGVEGDVTGSPGTQIGVHGVATRIGTVGTSGRGVVGESENNTGVEGDSISGRGVHGKGASGIAVAGESTNWYGMYGKNGPGSTLSPLFNYGGGVWGDTLNGIGVFGSSNSFVGMVGISNLNDGIQGYTHGNSRSGVVGIAASDSVNGTGGYFRSDSSGGQALYADGKAVVKVLQILGADLTESFNVAGDNPQAGDVVVIDEAHPGELKLCASAYDHKVAGIISGAGGIRTAVVMGQPGSIADGKHAVALTGRVYCRCDASDHAIQVGDLLTTSSTAGHAMKATDREKSSGAVIGKAMTSLDKGRGLVLVLVTLQ